MERRERPRTTYRRLLKAWEDKDWKPVEQMEQYDKLPKSTQQKLQMAYEEHKRYLFNFMTDDEVNEEWTLEEIEGKRYWLLKDAKESVDKILKRVDHDREIYGDRPLFPER